MQGERGDGHLLAPAAFQPQGEMCHSGSKSPACAIRGADSWFKEYTAPLIRNWSSHCPLSRGGGPGFHLLSSTDLTMGLFVNSFIWEGDLLPQPRCEQSLSLCALVPGCPRVFFSEAAASGALGFRTEQPCLPPIMVSDVLTVAGRTAEGKQDREQPRDEEAESLHLGFGLPPAGPWPLSSIWEEKGRRDRTGPTPAWCCVHHALTLGPLSSPGGRRGAWTDCLVLLAEEQNLFLSRLLVCESS